MSPSVSARWKLISRLHKSFHIACEKVGTAAPPPDGRRWPGKRRGQARAAPRRLYRKLGIQNGALPWVFGKAFSRGFFVQLVAHSAPTANRHIHSLRPIRLIFTASIDFGARRCERIRNPPARGSPPRPCDWHRCREGGDRSRYCGGVPGPAWIRPAARQSFVGR